MRMLEISDFSDEIQKNLEKQINLQFKKKYSCKNKRLRVLMANVSSKDKLNKTIYCEEIPYKCYSVKFIESIEIGHSYYFLIDCRNRILGEDVNHLFCPYLIEVK